MTLDRVFQSTLPAGEATTARQANLYQLLISIHASRGGSDRMRLRWVGINDTISIHASRGGSDLSGIPISLNRQISIHASRGGSDAK